MIKSLTSLRGIFILFIFFHHCLDLYPGGGSMAVAFFFILGGFSMTLGYKDKVIRSDFRFKQYLTRRCIKFYPFHWLCLLAVLPLSLLSFRMSQIPVFFANAALLQAWVPIKSVYFSFNWASWYLADTMFFAIVFPIVFRWIVSAGAKGRALIAILIASLYALLVVLLPKEQYHAILYISPYVRLTDFIFGIYLALLFGKLKHIPARWWNSKTAGQIIVFALITLLVVESCLLPENTRLIAPVYWILVGAVILIASLIKPSGGGYFILENKYLLRLGELSFVIFMIHQIVIRYSKIAFTKILHFDNDIIFVCFTLILTIVLSIVVERHILKPITQWLTKRIQPSMTVRS